MPRYETKLDTRNEIAIAKTVATHWGISVQKNAPMAAIDFMILDRQKHVVAWMEIKQRSRYSSTSFPSQWVDFEKYMHCINHAEISGHPFLLVYKLSDGIYYWKYQPSTGSKPETKTKAFASLGGRTDRNDPNDIKAVMNIPINEWKKLL